VAAIQANVHAITPQVPPGVLHAAPHVGVTSAAPLLDLPTRGGCRGGGGCSGTAGGDGGGGGGGKGGSRDTSSGGGGIRGGCCVILLVDLLFPPHLPLRAIYFEV
jgi:hypothetical protein